MEDPPPGDHEDISAQNLLQSFGLTQRPAFRRLSCSNPPTELNEKFVNDHSSLEAINVLIIKFPLPPKAEQVPAVYLAPPAASSSNVVIKSVQSGWKSLSKWMRDPSS